jgi:hypothetical protein
MPVWSDLIILAFRSPSGQSCKVHQLAAVAPSRVASCPPPKPREPTNTAPHLVGIPRLTPSGFPSAGSGQLFGFAQGYA